MVTLNIEGTYWVDNKLNSWSVETYTKAEAEKFSKSLVRCINCTDCMDCMDCINCMGCSDCNNCKDCKDCKSVGDESYLRGAL